MSPEYVRRPHPKRRNTPRKRSQMERLGTSPAEAKVYRLLKGCPCLMDFGTERICVNNDNIIPVRVINIDVRSAQAALGETRTASSKHHVGETRPCYGFVDVGRPDGWAYCALYDEPIVINGRRIPASDLEEAIEVVEFSRGKSEESCAPCIYKYLTTMGSIFEPELEPIEARRTLEAYVKHLTNKTETGTEESAEIYQKILRSHLRELLREKREWTRAMNTMGGKSNLEDVGTLLRLYQNVSRMEVVLHGQLLSLTERNSDEVRPFVIRRTAKNIVYLCEKIHEIGDKLLNEAVSTEVYRAIIEHKTNRQRIEAAVKSLLTTLEELLAPGGSASSGGTHSTIEAASE